jgi:FkbM family methyltransferase
LTPKGRQINAEVQRFHHDAHALYREFLRPGDLCFDVGANYGERVEIFLALGARVVALEPNVNCVRYLVARYRTYLHRVTVISKGAAESVGEREFRREAGTLMSTMSTEWIESIVTRSPRFARRTWEAPISVPVTTLDAVIAAHGLPAFAKIDVEGYEYHVLRGLTHAIPALSIEYTPERILPTLECIRYLISLGDYEFNYAVGTEMRLKLPAWQDGTTMLVTAEQLAATHESGDVYARLRRTSASR